MLCHLIGVHLVCKYSTYIILGINGTIYRPVLLVGAQWLSGRVLDSRPKGHSFEPHQRHCVVVLEQDTFILA